MAMKDTLLGVMRNAQGFVREMAQARWRSLSARDPLEKRVAKLQTLSLGAQQYLMQRTAAQKLRSLSDKPIADWPNAFLKNWDPKKDFAFAMLHAERLIQLLTHALVAELLLEQAREYPERRELLERYVDRYECHARFLHEEITTTGDRLLRKLGGTQEDELLASGE